MTHYRSSEHSSFAKMQNVTRAYTFVFRLRNFSCHAPNLMEAYKKAVSYMGEKPSRFYFTSYCVPFEFPDPKPLEKSVFTSEELESSVDALWDGNV